MEFCGHSSPTDYFYPRPPRGGRLLRSVRQDVRNDISIHALREEGDSASVVAALDTLEFLSTPSARRATAALSPSGRPQRYFYPRPPRGGRQRQRRRCPRHPRISIHALREEGDAIHQGQEEQVVDFYPRPPRGGRPTAPAKTAYKYGEFLSTPSARRATLLFHRRNVQQRGFLSTPSARRATIRNPRKTPSLRNFYPRPPRGGRPGRPARR